MKRISFLALLLAALTWTACSDDDNDTPDDEPGGSFDIEVSLVVETDTVYMPPEGGTVNIPVKISGSPIMVSVDQEWVDTDFDFLSPVNIEFNVERYEVKQKPNDCRPRTAQILISVGLDDEEIEDAVVVVQRPFDYLEPSETSRVNCVAQPYRCDWRGSGLYVGVNANGPYTVEMPWWIEQINCKQEGETYSTCGFSIMHNYDARPRVGKVVFKLGTETFTCTVEQEATLFDFSQMTSTAQEIVWKMTFGWTDSYTRLVNVEAQEDYSPAVLADCGLNIINILCPFVKADCSIDSILIDRLHFRVAMNMAYGFSSIVSFDTEGWFSSHLNVADTAEVFPLFEHIWTSVAELFRSSNEEAIFMSMNHFDASKSDQPAKVFERLNEIFVQTVRRAGECNYRRHLIVPVYDADNDVCLNVPDDPMEDRLMVAFDFFCPRQYTSADATCRLWGEPFAGAAEYCEEWSAADIQSLFGRIANRYPAYPILLSGFGSVAHSESESDIYAVGEALYANAVAKAATDNGIKVIVDDDGHCGIGGNGFYFSEGSRETTKMFRPLYFEGIKAGVEGREFKISTGE